jgi:hypothetical protein
MRVKVSTIDYEYTKDVEATIAKIKQERPGPFYPAIVDLEDEIDLSKLAVKDRMFVIAVKDLACFEKKVICNVYQRTE